MNPKIRNLVSPPVTSPPKQVNWIDRVTAAVRGFFTWFCLQVSHVQDVLDQMILGVADLVIPTMSEQFKTATTWGVKAVTLFVLGYVFLVQRKKKGPAEKGGEE